MNPNKKAAPHLSGKRPCLEFDRAKHSTSEEPEQATYGEDGGGNSGRTRARCESLLIASQGEGGMRVFLRQSQPDLGNRTGAELLETDPDDLLRRLEAIVENNPCQP